MRDQNEREKEACTRLYRVATGRYVTGSSARWGEVRCDGSQGIRGWRRATEGRWLGEVKGVERVGEEKRKRERRDSRSVAMGVRETESREEKEKGGENKRDERGQRKRQGLPPIKCGPSERERERE
jgi:hypothetical protein